MAIAAQRHGGVAGTIGRGSPGPPIVAQIPWSAREHTVIQPTRTAISRLVPGSAERLGLFARGDPVRGWPAGER
jgi:hypothetical protein